MMSLKSKIEDKVKEARHPSFLIYYGFSIDKRIYQPLNVIGIQASSIRGIQKWIQNDNKSQVNYRELSENLRELLDVTRA